MSINLIVAFDSKRGIGLNGDIPWKIKDDLKYFKEKTVNSTVIMGRRTWESIGSKSLPDRENIIISKTLRGTVDGQFSVYTSLNNALKYILSQNVGLLNLKKIFIIGGQELYSESLYYFNNLIDSIYITEIKGDYKCDKFFPILTQKDFILHDASDLKEENGIKYRYLHYKTGYKATNGEYDYLFLLNNLINKGDKRQTRNSMTRSLFGQRLEFNLAKYFPMATIRNVPLKWIFEELMWIIRGQTDSKILEDKGITIWKGNTSREFLDKNNLSHFKEGEVGPTYGFLMRNFGGDYPYGEEYYGNSYEKNMERAGCDQLMRVIQKIKENPNDRRLVISLWDPNNIDKCALPPCLRDYQFYVSGGKLSCQATLRSSDMPVALHWNICTAALLTHLIAKECDLGVERLIMVIGDCHIYEEHIVEVQDKLLRRVPRAYPMLRIKEKRGNITDYEYTDLEVIGYHPDKTPLNLKMVA